MQRQDEREEALNLKDTVSKLMPELEKELIYTLFIGNIARIYDYGYLGLLGIKTECGGALDYGSMPQMKRKRNGLHSGSSGILKPLPRAFQFAAGWKDDRIPV